MPEVRGEWRTTAAHSNRDAKSTVGTVPMLCPYRMIFSGLMPYLRHKNSRFTINFGNKWHSLSPNQRVGGFIPSSSTRQNTDCKFVLMAAQSASGVRSGWRGTTLPQVNKCYASANTEHRNMLSTVYKCETSHVQINANFQTRALNGFLPPLNIKERTRCAKLKRFFYACTHKLELQ